MNKDMDVECIEVKKKGGSFGSWVKGLFWGSILGAGVALLSTPRTGEENRAMIRQKGMELRDKAMDQTEQVRNKAADVTDRGKDLLNEQKNQVKSAIHGVKKGIENYQEENQKDMSMSSSGLPATGEPFDSMPHNLDDEEPSL